MTVSKWHYDSDGRMICDICGSEVWYLENGYICSGRNQCINEDSVDSSE